MFLSFTSKVLTSSWYLSISKISLTKSVKPDLFSPHNAKIIASISPSITLRILLSILPLNCIICRSGLDLSNMAFLRGEQVPTLALIGKSAKLENFFDNRQSLTSCLTVKANISVFWLRNGVKSLAEWTAISILFSSKASSSSLMNKPFPPNSARLRSWIL